MVSKYFKDVLNKVNKVIKKNGFFYLGEIVDKSKQIEFNNYRKTQLSKKEYKENYLGKKNIALKHFSLTRLQLISFLEKDFKNIEIFNSELRGKEKEVFRFNVCCQKK